VEKNMSAEEWVGWGDYDEEPPAEYEYFDRIIASTKKAILYGYLESMFWLPRSVHSCSRAMTDAEPGEVMIEGWATIIKNRDPNWVDVAARDAEVEALFKRINS